MTHRLVESRRVGGKARQVTLLNLGRQFPLPKERWPQLCARIEQLLGGQQALMPMTVAESVERCAQHCFSRLVAQGSGTASRGRTAASDQSPSAFVEIDPDSLELTQPRSIGVEHVALAAMRELGFERLLESLGFNGVMRTAIVGLLAIALNSDVQAIHKRADGRLDLTASGLPGSDQPFAAVMFATGRVANTVGLGLTEVGVKLDKHGGEVVDALSSTNVAGIHAVGDVTNRIEAIGVGPSNVRCATRRQSVSA